MWCSEQLGKLETLLQQKVPVEVALLAVSTDSRADSERMREMVAETAGIPLTFPLLSDENHRVIDRYGLLNMGTSPGPSTRAFATPATFLIDPSGVVTWRMVEENWKIRPTNELILAALDKVIRGEDASTVTQASLVIPDAADDSDTPSATRSTDTKDMVRIESGVFKTGTAGRTDGDAPERDVELSAYFVDVYEVTNSKYRLFLQSLQQTQDHETCHPSEPDEKKHTPQHWEDPRYNGDRFPVVGVDWYDAYAYCAWEGKQLPTEAQWEVAARAGFQDRDYPWGDGIDETKANLFEAAGETGAVLRDQGTFDTGVSEGRGPKPVGSYEPNGLGLFDIIGNAEEWCSDWYDEDYYRRSPAKDPKGPQAGVIKVVRGASWHHAKGRFRTRYTHPPDVRAAFLGFRCVAPADAIPTKK